MGGQRLDAFGKMLCGLLLRYVLRGTDAPCVRHIDVMAPAFCIVVGFDGLTPLKVFL